MRTEVMLQAHRIAKAYGGRVLFRDVELTLHAGEAIAFMGRNGSGKTTLLRMLGGLVTPTEGVIERAPGVSIGYVPEHFPKMNLTAAQYIRHMGRIEGLRQEEVQRRRDALLEAFFLQGMAGVPMKHLSKGSLQKVGVVQALLSNHHILLLDEPLSGQDADSQRAFVEHVKRRKGEGAAILLSCHEPQLVRELADVAYTVGDGTLTELSLDSRRFVPRIALMFAYDPIHEPLPQFAGCDAQADRGLFRITAPLSMRDEILARLIPMDVRLRGMRDENDD